MRKANVETTKKTKLLYVAVGITSSVSLIAVYYGILRINSSLGLLYAHNSFTYFILYVVLTIGTSVLFGVSTAQFVFQWRRYGLRRIFHHGSGGIGALVGLIASSCPVCGSAFLSAAGIAGGLSSLPFQGLEVKTLSFLLVAGSVLYSSWWLRRKGCTDTSCPPELDDSIRKPSYIVFMPFLVIILFFSALGWNLYQTDIIRSPSALQSSYVCSSH
ncbi:MAG: hypothetical protein ACM3IJ_03830 [Candidatus Levyibacteriota bacterium]